MVIPSVCVNARRGCMVFSPPLTDRRSALVNGGERILPDRIYSDRRRNFDMHVNLVQCQRIARSKNAGVSGEKTAHTVVNVRMMIK